MLQQANIISQPGQVTAGSPKTGSLPDLTTDVDVPRQAEIDRDKTYLTIATASDETPCEKQQGQVMSEDKALYPPIEPVSAGIKGRCPRCGQGKMFDGFIALPKHCSNCGLDYSFVDTGEGPAVLVMLLIGFIVVGLALWMEVTLGPPLWLHFILWIPLALVLCLAALRWMKGILIALQYKHNAAEGRIDRSDQPK